MINNEWIDYPVGEFEYDEYIGDKIITKDIFESAVGDQFVAVKVNGKNFPEMIYTEHYIWDVRNQVLINRNPVEMGLE